MPPFDGDDDRDDDSGDVAPLFRLFWENGALGPHVAADFAERLAEDARTSARAPELLYPGEEQRLPLPDDPLARLARARRSTRTFAPAPPLSIPQIGSLFAACAAHPADSDSDDNDGSDRDNDRPRGRAVASAGGKYPIELFALLFDVEGPLCGHIVYYNAHPHSLSVVGRIPAPRADPGLRADLGLDGLGDPAAVIVLVAFPSRTTRKYGERGGRFLLLEAGQCLHALALRAAHERLAGVALGGLRDARTKTLLGLAPTEAAVVVGYAVGAPTSVFR